MLFTKAGERVPAEAAALERGRHHGVVELVGVVDGALRTRWVEGRTLAEIGALPPEELAGICGAIAAILADLHQRGVVHGGLDPTHVLVTPEGRPVLCSLGRDGEPADDVAALGRLMALPVDAADPHGGDPQVGPGRGRHALGPMLAPPVGPALADLAAAAQTAGPAVRPTARELATAIADRVPGARLPRPPAAPLLPLPRPAADSARRRRPGNKWRPPVRLLGGAVAAVAALVGVSVVLAGSRPDGTRPSTEVTSSPPTTTPPAPSSTTTVTVPPPAAIRVWPREPLDLRDGVLTTEDGSRYRVGQVGDTAVSGDWACTGRSTVALLRPDTGEVFAFDDWAEPGRDVVARPVGQVPGATALEVADVDGDGCADLLVATPGRDPVPLVAMAR